MAQYNPYNQSSGGDPRGTIQNAAGYQQQRYNQQQGPMANQFALMTGRANETDYGDRVDIMNRYRNVADNGLGGDERGHTWGPSKISYNDPFKSYGGYEEFSRTGGYSRDDITNMRSRGVSPIRAAYANAQREVGRQRSLQGGYSPNAVAAQVKMAREQGQAAADATQNVEAGLAEARNRGRLSGLGGMSGIETSRLGADLDVAKFNANAQMAADAANAATANSLAAEGRGARLGALQGMTQLYGTTPGMSETFGNQLLSAVGQGGTFGQQMLQNQIAGQALPGAYEQTMNRINTGINTGRNAAQIAGTINYGVNSYRNRNQPQGQQPIVGQRPNYGNVPTSGTPPIGGSFNPGYGQVPQVRR